MPPADPRDAAQRRHLTVMFCDLVASTPLAESLDPEDFRDVLRDFQDACSRPVERFGGFTARYTGDGLVVYFGYPQAHEDDPHRALHAGLGILDELATLNIGLRQRLGISLHVRIGVHTGLVVAGEMGGGATREERGIVGEVPHIGARLESIAEPDTIATSDVTVELTAGYFETVAIGERELKGVSRLVSVHRVLRATGAVGRLDVPGGGPLTPIVSRDEELARLARAWERVSEGGDGILVHIRGEAGIGKSRLVHALRERIGFGAGAVQVWQCSAHHESSPLHPVIRFLDRLLAAGAAGAAGAADDPARRLVVLERIVAEAGLDAAAALPPLADLLALAMPGQAAAATMTPRDTRAATMHALEALLVTNTAQHPLVLVAEDLHWADPTTVELIGRVVAGLDGVPVLCVLTFRREFVPPWTASERVVDVELGRLGDDAVRAMMATTGAAALDAPVIEQVAAAADGVPLFVEEMLRMLHGSGPVQPSTRHAADATNVPSSLQGLLTARLDRLADLGDVIDLAAVLGREFSLDVLQALEPVADLDAALAQLVAEDVLRISVDGHERSYEFVHTLLHEAAYELILRRHRRELHARVAGVLTGTFPTLADQEPEAVARHWSAAGQPGQARPWWQAAGTRALERAAFIEAADHFVCAIEALDASDDAAAGGPALRVELLTLLAASLQAGRGYSAAGAADAYAQARAAAASMADGDRLVPVIRGQWMLHLLRAEYATALELADEMLALGTRSEVHRAEGHLYRGLVHMYRGDLERSREDLEEAFVTHGRLAGHDQVYDAQGDTGVGALAYLASVLLNLGHVDESRQRSDDSLTLAEHVGGPMTRAQAWGMRSLLHLTRGEPVELARWTEQTRVHSTDRNIAYWRILSSIVAGWLEGRAGRVDAGIARLQANLDAYVESGSTLGLPLFSTLLSDLWLAAGDQRRALDVLCRGEEHIEATGERFVECELLQAKGKLLMAADPPDAHGAGIALERALAAARAQQAKLLELRAATRLALHQRRVGEPCTALADLTTVVDWFGPTSELPDVTRARALVSGRAATR